MTKKRTPPDQTKHGGEAAIKRLQHGEPLDGLALQEQARVIDAYEADGRPAMIELNAIRLQTVANLFYDACTRAVDAGDLEAMDRWVKRFGWLAGCSLRAWEQHRKEEAAAGSGVTAAQVLDVMRGDTTNEQND